MNRPVISVVLPTFNRAHLLGRSVRSVLEQSYENLELIIVDDGSTDNSANVIRRLSDKRVHYVHLAENKGAPFARNIGLRMAVGRYIAFQDSDDEWSKGKLERQIEVFSDCGINVGVVYSGYWEVKNRRRIYLPRSGINPKNGNVHNLLLAGNFIAGPTALVRTECFAKHGLFDERLPRLQEWELWLRISPHWEFRFIDEPLVTAYVQPDGITSSPEKLVKAFELILEKHDEDFRRHSKALAHVYYLVGSQLLHSERTLAKEKIYQRQAFRIDPTKARYFLLALSSFLGKMWLLRAVMLFRKLKSLFGR